MCLMRRIGTQAKVQKRLRKADRLILELVPKQSKFRMTSTSSKKSLYLFFKKALNVRVVMRGFHI